MAREQLEEEHQAKADSQRQLNKAFSVVSLWRQKYEKDGLAKAEEPEAARLKIQARLTEAQNIIEDLGYKAMALEKEKALLQTTIEEMNSYRDIAGHRCRPEEEEAQV